MSAARPAPRRIVPQLVAPSQAVRPAAAFGEADDVSQSASQPAQQLDLREQAAIAAKKLGPGRRIFVDLEKNGNVVDWHKLLKTGGALPSKQPPAEPADGPAVSGSLFKESSRPKNVFSSVIQRLEQAYVLNDGEESNSSEEEPAERQGDSGQSAEEDGAPERKGGESGKESGKEGKGKRGNVDGPQKDDQYDYDDNFIDDSEFIEYYGGDRHKAKHSGFFVNSGEIEKTGELIDKQQASLKKRRKKPAAAESGGGGGAAGGAGPDGAPAAKRPKVAKRKPQPGQSPAPAAGAAPSAAAAVGLAAMDIVPETRDGFETVPATPTATPGSAPSSSAFTGGPEVSAAGISGAAPAAPTSAAKKKIGSVPGGDKPYVPSREINAALEALRAMAAAEPASAIPAEGANKKIPDGLRAALGEFFIGIYDRETKRHTAGARPVLVTRLMEFMDPFTSRPNLQRLLKTLTDKLDKDYQLAKTDLRRLVGAAASAAAAAAGSPGPAARQHFVWSPELLQTLVDFVHLRCQVKGRAQVDKGKIWSPLADFWPNKMMDPASIQKAHNSAVASQPPRSLVAPARKAAPPAAVTLPPPAATAAAATPLPAVLPSVSPLHEVSDILQRSGSVASRPAPAISPAPQVAAVAAPAPAPFAPPKSLAPVHTGAAHQPLQQQQSPVWLAGADFSNAASVGGAEPSNAASPPAVVDPARHVDAGAAGGGSRVELAAAAAAFQPGSMKFLLNLVLMHAGRTGFRVAEIVEKAAEVGVADWRGEKNKRSYISSVVSKEACFINVGGYRYALRAFPGVAEAGAAVEEAKRNAAAAAAANAAAAEQAAAVAGGMGSGGGSSVPTAAALGVHTHLQAAGQSAPAAQPPTYDTNPGTY